jgi:hypothetical protein
MPRLALALCAVLVAAPLRAQDGHPLPPDQVAAALADTRHSGAYTMGPFRVTTAYARVVEEKRTADKALRPLTAADLAPALLTDDLVVWAYARTVPATVASAPTVDSPVRVLLRPKGTTDAAQALQPGDTQAVPQAYGNAYGAQWQAQHLAARFPRQAVQSGTWEIVAVYQSGRTVTADLKLAGKR